MTTPLSAHEQKVLAELELQLLDVDTSAVDTSEEAQEQLRPEKTRRYWSRRHPVIGVLAAVAGAVLLALGASLPSLAVGVAGFVLMGAGVYFATLAAGTPRRKRTKTPAGPAATDESPGAGRTAETGQSSVGGGIREAAWWSLLFWL